MKVTAPLSVGDLADRITILDLKLQRIHDPERRKNIRRELNALEVVWFGSVSSDSPQLAATMQKLREVNARIWDLEDQAHEHASGTTLEAILRENNERAALKRSINLITDSELIEEKSYGGADA